MVRSVYPLFIDQLRGIVEEVHFGLIVWENAFATTPLPSGVFRGPYDEYWSAKPNGGGNECTHVGEKLKWTLERYPDGVSPFQGFDEEPT